MVNIRDIAHHAGVSVSTVSRVLNDYPYVSNDKRERVLKSMETLHYIPSQLAVNLSRGRSRTIACVIPYIANPYYAKLLAGAIKEASQSHHHIVVIETSYNEEEEMKALEMLRHRSVDGVIFTTRQLSLSRIADYLNEGPIILMEKNDITRYVYIDQQRALQEALNHLIEKGYKQIGYTLHRKHGFSATERLKAYETIPDCYRADEYIYTGGLSARAGVKLAETILGGSIVPDALIVTNDEVSAGLYAELLRMGIKVPEELALVSYENGELAQVHDLTSIDLPLEEMGAEAIRMILEPARLSNEIPFTLIERSST
ncbi:LacI family DNA-binding transcriptional regulator [Macrococcus bovicus]|uniref:LacI family DNA-binding transcriptional regulator n=1 Tax=Macrococcus bovicus TaxID=69968 RepID=UPI0025A5EA75|nr:LacI family DNA-binding transcriptional regulator [Macrococcus bovicus]WJP97858.1 LacI family DNA-binding transcriptional regulator [Macrococcus bovicus]